MNRETLGILLSLLLALLLLSGCSSREEQLYEAIGQGDYARAQSLIRAGADVNMRIKFGYTPLFISNDPETTQLLLDQGAEVNLKGGGAFPETKTLYAEEHDYAPLHVVKDHHVAKLLLAAGADVDVRDRFANTPLHRASTIALVRTLIEQGADVNARAVDDSTPLKDLVNNDPDEVTPIAELLLAAGADPNLADSLGHTPLHSVRWDNWRLAEILIDAGADYRHRSQGGSSPLCYAIADNSMELIKLYFRSGADFTMTCEAEKTLLEYAEKKANKQVFGFLKELRVRLALQQALESAQRN